MIVKIVGHVAGRIAPGDAASVKEDIPVEAGV